MVIMYYFEGFLMKKKFEFTVFPLLLAGLAVSTTHAEDTNKKSLVDQFEVHGVVTLSSDYRSRGFTKSNHEPSVQGGLVLTHTSGAYAMLWGASATTPNGGSVEADMIVGYVLPINENVVLDFFYADVNYPGGLGQSPDFGEYGVMYRHNNAFMGNDSLKAAFYYSPEYLFNSGNEYYVWGEYSAPIVSKISGFAALGYTKQDSVAEFNMGTAPDADQDDYIDYKVGVRADFKGVTTELAWVDNNIDSQLDMFDGRMYFSITKQF